MHPLLSSVPNSPNLPGNLLAPRPPNTWFAEKSIWWSKCPMSCEREHSLFCPGRIKLLESILPPNTVGRICSNEGWYLWLWYSSACCLHPRQRKSPISTIPSVNAPSPWLYFYTACISQTSTILCSKSNYDPLSLNLSLWQEEAGNIAGKPSNWDQNQSSRKM